jgi:hypothetical protein
VIKDPWRTGQAAPDPEEKVVGSSNSDHPLDADLKPETYFPIRVPGQGHSFLARGATSPAEAIDVLLRAVEKLSELKKALNEGHLFIYQPIDPQTKVVGFVISNNKNMLWNPGASNAADGFNKLIRGLLAYNRQHPGELEKHGIIPQQS